jgi:hypothetical protein
VVKTKEIPADATKLPPPYDLALHSLPVAGSPDSMNLSKNSQATDCKQLEWSLVDKQIRQLLDGSYLEIPAIMQGDSP